MVFRFLIALAFLLCCASPGFPATYYVKTGGNDAAAGTSDAEAWAHSPDMGDDWTGTTTLVSGDSVYFRSEDTWTGTTSAALFRAKTAGVNYSGSAYGTGTRATFTTSTTAFCVASLDASVLFTGFDINMGSKCTGGIGVGSYATSSFSGVTIVNCLVHDSLWPANPVGQREYRYGINIGGYAANDVVVDSVLLENTEVYNTGHEGICLYPTILRTGCKATNVTIRNCTVYNTGQVGEGYSEGFYVVNMTEGLLVEYCTIYNVGNGIDLGTSTVYGGTPTNCTFRRNFILDNTYGFVFNPISGMNGTVSVHDNIFSGNLVGIKIDQREYNDSRIEIDNNTIRQEAVNDEYAVWVIAGATGNAPFFLRNNLMLTGDSTVINFGSAAVEALFSHSNNLIYNSWGAAGVHVLIDGTASYNRAGVLTWDATSQNTEPSLLNATGAYSAVGDFQLGPASPAINTGTNTGRSTDFYGSVRPQGGAYDIGAFEFPVSTIGYGVTLGGGVTFR